MFKPTAVLIDSPKAFMHMVTYDPTLAENKIEDVNDHYFIYDWPKVSQWAIMPKEIFEREFKTTDEITVIDLND